MEYRYSKKRAENGIPIWLVLVLGGLIILLTIVLLVFVLMYRGNMRCESRKDPVAVASPAPTEQTQPIAPEDPSSEPTPQPIGEVTPAPLTPEPIVTAEPTEEPTPAPTPVPDAFPFGGKTVKIGATSVIGSKLGINGKAKNPTHITEEEVENLVKFCPDLEELVLDYCYMDDYEPLGNLDQLRKLQLSHCGSGSGNAITDIDWLQDLTSLRSLNLKENEISDTKPLQDLTKLTYLNLGGNPLTDEDLEPIGNLKNLTELQLYDMKKITDVQPLSNLSKLTVLNIGRNSRLKNIKPLTKLKKLKTLRIYHTNISDISYFKNFAALKELDLSKCPILFSDYYYLEDCAKLRTIVLEAKYDSDASLAIDDMINNGYPFEIKYTKYD